MSKTIVVAATAQLQHFASLLNKKKFGGQKTQYKTLNTYFEHSNILIRAFTYDLYPAEGKFVIRQIRYN